MEHARVSLATGPCTVAQFRVKRTRDVHVHAGHLSAWNQEYEQVSRGVFSGVVREIVAPGLQVFEEWASCATAQHCRPWSGGVWIGIPVPADPQGLRYMGRSVDGLHWMWANDDQFFDLFVPSGVGLYGLVVDASDMMHHLRWRDGTEECSTGQSLLKTAWSGMQMQRLTPTQRQRLAGLLREVLNNVERTPEVLRHDTSRQALHHAVLGIVCDMAVPEEVQPVLVGRYQRRLTLVRRARELILERPQDFCHLTALCAALHVTRRTLQNCFQEVMGISPAAYLREVRLNAVRRALLDPHGARKTITDIAAQWGFWHMGHFGCEYKALFGETPSETRARACRR
jgi:AraC family ethanolamine operon transcriptional activator